jgi:transcriptional regulator with GAF, ATPase, and Fis domain
VSAPAIISLAAVGEKAERLRGPAAERLQQQGFDTRLVPDRSSDGAQVVLFDAAAPPVFDLLRQLDDDGAGCLLAVASDRSGLRNGGAWKLLFAGASDVFGYDESPEWVTRVAARVQRWRRVEELAGSRQVCGGLVGESRRWRAAMRDAVEAATFTDAPTVLTGETGTGKELVARLIHSLDPRPRKGELVLLDCTTIVPTLSGSEFFGHERGAFTGAMVARDGAFSLANGGTLFLDEVGELPLGLQSELLRVVQEGAYKRVGGNDWRKTSFRLVCATNRDLFAEAAAGRFRHDLLYRLAGSMLHLPRLRERRGDILLLARHFLSELGESSAADFDHDVEAFLLSRDYPGNVRELRQLMTRIAYRHVGPGPITVGDVPQDERAADLPEPASSSDSLEHGIRQAVARGLTLREISAAASDAAIRVALAEEHGNLQRAAGRLGVTPRALQLRRAAGRLSPAQTERQLTTGG